MQPADTSNVCTPQTPENCLDLDATPQAITPHAAHDLMASGQPYVLLDARTPEAYEARHIPGAHSLPHDEVSAAAASGLIPSKDALVLVYCESGYLASLEEKALRALGYTNVHDFGGIEDWPYETVGGSSLSS